MGTRRGTGITIGVAAVVALGLLGCATPDAQTTAGPTAPASATDVSPTQAGTTEAGTTEAGTTAATGSTTTIPGAAPTTPTPRPSTDAIPTGTVSPTPNAAVTPMPDATTLPTPPMPVSEDIPEPLVPLDELPAALGMATAIASTKTTEEFEGATYDYLDLYGSAPAGCRQSDGDASDSSAVENLPEPLGWNAVAIGQQDNLMASMFRDPTGDVGTAVPLSVFSLYQGIATPDDAAGIIADKAADVAACPPPGTLPQFLIDDQDAPAVQLAAPDVGDQAVAWRSTTIFPEAFLVVIDTVWWRRGDQVAAMSFWWAPGNLPGAGGPGAEPPPTPEPIDPAGFLADAGDEAVQEALADAADALDERL